MARAGAPSGKDGGSTRLGRVGALIARRPRRIVVAWLLTVAVFAFLGLGLEGKLTTQSFFIDGTATKREHQIVVRDFGSENAVVVLLRGPRGAVERQGRDLERRLNAMPRVLVLSPWAAGGTVEGLSPSPGAAALVVTVKSRPGEGLLEVLPPVRQKVDETISGRVTTSIAGAPATLDSLQNASADAASVGERIAIPVLLIVLLLVFRSVLAAAMPVIVGGAVVATTRGILDLLLGVIHLDSFALGAVGMMGLALGVDYSLLVISRFREEIGEGFETAEAIQRTVIATGRTVITAGAGLCLAMLAAAQLLPGAIVASVAVAVATASVLSVISAVLVVPAFLALLGPNLDRWALPRRQGRRGWASALSARFSKRPRLAVLPIVLILALAAAWAFTLDTGIATVALLPSDDPGRRQQEEVQRTLGPGWVAPLEIVMEGRDEPVTTPDRLHALADFQRQVERDPGVATMTGFAGMERGARQLAGLERSLTAQEEGLGKLNRGMSRVHDGAVLSTQGLLQAADGARRLDTAVGATHDGAGFLADGLSTASGGSNRLSTGLDRVSGGSGKLASGTSKASAGADRLSTGLARAQKQTGELTSSARTLENAMESGEQRLAETDVPIQTVEGRLAVAQAALQGMTTGRGDPKYAATLEAVEDAITWLTGTDPRTGEPSSVTTGAVKGIERAGGQFGLGLYLAKRLDKSGHKASKGMAKLARGSDRLNRGLARLAVGSRQVSAGIDRLSLGGQKLSPGLERLSQGAERLADGLGKVQKGAGGLAGGLGGGAQKSKLLAGALQRINDGVERKQGPPGESQVDQLNRESPGLFHSGYFYLASLDGSAPERRRQAGFMVSLDHGGSAARMLVIPRYDPSDPRARETRDRLAADASELAGRTNTQVVVGGITAIQLDVDSAFRNQAPLARLVLALITILILIPVVRSLTVAVLAALLNVLTVAATFGFLALLFDGSLLGGPGYVDTAVIPATIMVIFGLAIDYEVFIFARIREEYVRTGSSEAAITNGLARTAPVVTGAALIMIVVFLSFAVSSFATMRNFGVAQAIGVSIDAFLVRLIVVPAMMRALGRYAWWMPRWLDRLLPGTPNPAARISGEGAS